MSLTRNVIKTERLLLLPNFDLFPPCTLLHALCSRPYALCSKPYALCSKPYALCSKPYALCSKPYAHNHATAQFDSTIIYQYNYN